MHGLFPASETSGIQSISMWLIVWGDFAAYSRRADFKNYKLLMFYTTRAILVTEYARPYVKLEKFVRYSTTCSVANETHCKTNRWADMRSNLVWCAPTNFVGL
jgi:hypothetical protein